MKRLITVLIMLAIIVAVIFIFFKNIYNPQKIGNTTYKIEDLENYILKISSYEAIAEIRVASNKNTNTYKLKQSEKRGGSFYQEVIEPQTIAGSIFKSDGSNLIIENSKLNISKIYENYHYISNNQLSLINFLNDYNESQDANCIENDTEVIMEVSVKNENKYIAKKVLKVDKASRCPKSLEIHDNTQNLLVYILYNEIKINVMPEDQIAFLYINIKSEI